MRQYTSWSILLFRWRNVHVRMHMFFLLFAAFTLFLGSSHPDENGIWIAAGAVGILLLSVLIHELGHSLAAAHFGGRNDLLVLGPLGGLCPLEPPPDSRHEFIAHVAGPLVNLAACLVTGVAIAAQAGGEWLELLHPLSPQKLFINGGGVGLFAFKLIFWVNWVLFLANLLPAFPFDGGRAFRAALLALNPEMTPRRAAYIVASLAKLAAVGLLVLAVLWWSDTSSPVMPVWFSLVLLALFVFFSAKQEEERTDDADSEDEMFGYDFSQGYTSLERTSDETPVRSSPFRRWLDERRQAREEQQKRVEAEEEHRVDEILTRLHEQGMNALSSEDRSLLKRVSERLRFRQSKGS